jgi:hypothetical protein
MSVTPDEEKLYREALKLSGSAVLGGAGIVAMDLAVALGIAAGGEVDMFAFWAMIAMTGVFGLFLLIVGAFVMVAVRRYVRKLQ